MSPSLSSINPFNPILACSIYLTIEIIIFLIIFKCEKYKPKSFFYKFADIISKYSTIILITNIFLASVLSCNQLLYGLKHLTFTSDVSYYLKVDIDEYDYYNTIKSSISNSSYNAVLHYFGMSYDSLTQRRLTSTGSQGTVIVYAKSSFRNIINENDLTDFCYLDNNLNYYLNCLEFNTRKSFLPLVMNMSSCTLLHPLNVSINILSQNSTDLTLFFADNYENKNPSSSILINYYPDSMCPDQYNSNLFDKSFHNSIKLSGILGVFPVYINSSYLIDQFFDSLKTTAIDSLKAVILCFIFLSLSFKSVIKSTLLLFCLILSAIISFGCLPLFEYQSFSAFNIMSIYILIGVGGTIVLLFSNSWDSLKDKISHNENRTIFLTSILEASYMHIGLAALYTSLATSLSLFSKLDSPVIVISQLGAFMGVSYLSFYIIFHLIILPYWVSHEKILHFCDFNSKKISCGEFMKLLNLLQAKVSKFSKILPKFSDNLIFIIKLAFLISISIITAIQSYEIINLDFGIPQIFSLDSNLGKLFYLSTHYKPSLLKTQGFKSSNKKSSFTGPSRTPTNKPIQMPFNTNTKRPTIHRETTNDNYNYKVSKSNHTDYVIIRCYGISQYKKYKDGDVVPIYDINNFYNYTKEGLANDLNMLCKIVENKRNSLDISPTWNMTRDCIDFQLKEINKTFPELSMDEQIKIWAQKSQLTRGFMLGTSFKFIPLWICTNFTLTSPIPSLSSNIKYTKRIISKWSEMFSDNDDTMASKFNVNILVTSEAFSYPLLAAAVIDSITFAGIVSVAGFIGLILIFTFDFILTIIGAITMISIFSISLFIKLNFISPLFDLLDVVVLIAVVGMLVDFPIHMILRFQNEYKQTTNNERKWKTFSELRYALAFPLTLAILSGIPLLKTSLILIRKTGEYIIVLSLVSYSVSAFILPNILRFYCHHLYLKSSYCKNSATIIENENILLQ